MEDDKVFALNLSLYLGEDLGDFINFMVLLRSHVNILKEYCSRIHSGPVDPSVPRTCRPFPRLPGSGG
ncbi:hypothetical protein TNCV_1347811 [Trichonephila clavipes]|nr:hypothetical protein TNCV_1347811 [Trichonephila clavipes]